MKFYRYKQVQRLTFFGWDDVYFNDPDTLSRQSDRTQQLVHQDTKLMRFNFSQLYNIQLSNNARLVIEKLGVPDVVPLIAPMTVRMNNLNTNSYDSERNNLKWTLIYATDRPAEEMTNTSPEILYNFSISTNFFQNGFIELLATYPDCDLAADDLGRFFISFVVYDIDEEDLLLKDTPDVNYKDFRPHYNINNGRIPK
jgi:hypothetical protein